MQSELAYLTTQLNEEMLTRQKVEQELSDVREESRLMQRKNAHALKVRVVGCNICGSDARCGFLRAAHTRWSPS